MNSSFVAIAAGAALLVSSFFSMNADAAVTTTAGKITRVVKTSYATSPTTTTSFRVVKASSTFSVKSQPVNTIAWEGNGATFNLDVLSKKTLKYSWTKDGAVVGTAKSYAISAVAPSHAGTYGCKVTDGTLTYTCNEFTLTVNEIVRIASQPSGLMLNEGNPADLSVTATGTGPLKYQWYFNGSALPGQTSASINFSSALPTDSGKYYCVVSNAGSSATSGTALVSVLAKPVTGSAELAWSTPHSRENGAPLDASEIASYNIYYGNDSNAELTLIAQLSGQELNYVVTDLGQGTHYFAASAVDINGMESQRSAVVSKTIQ